VSQPFQQSIAQFLGFVPARMPPTTTASQLNCL
jgi:hypothetical protein